MIQPGLIHGKTDEIVSSCWQKLSLFSFSDQVTRSHGKFNALKNFLMGITSHPMARMMWKASRGPNEQVNTKMNPTEIFDLVIRWVQWANLWFGWEQRLRLRFDFWFSVVSTFLLSVVQTRNLLPCHRFHTMAWGVSTTHYHRKRHL